MKKILLLTLVSALAAVSMAQVAGPGGGVGAPPQSGLGKAGKIDRKEMEKINEEILAKLNLTPEQTAKLKAHREEMEGKVKDLRKGAKGGDKEAMKEKVKALRKENQEFMKTLLTKPQMREMQKLRREKLKEMRDKSETPTKP